MLQENSLRSILIVSIASLVGSIAAILIINFFRRKYILVATFSMLSVLFAIAGASLIATDKADQAHVLTTVFYAILQFIFNLGPNTLIFVLAAEIFPTVYRGTFYGIAAASGKVGAIIIRAIIAGTTNSEMSLGIRLLVFVPLMLVSALISWFLPDVQIVPKSIRRGTGLEAGSDGQQPAVTQKPPSGGTQQQVPAGEVQAVPVSDVSSDISVVQPGAAVQNIPLLGRLKNIALEDIAPNPAWDRGNKGGLKKTTEQRTSEGGITDGQTSAPRENDVIHGS
jgi:MFS transporter, PHS family, inorganic phosphate transporter